MISKKKFNKQNISLAKRLSLIIIGLIGSMALIVYSFRWDDMGINADIIGYDISKWFFAGILVISGVIFATMLKSGLLGKWKLD